MEARLTAKSRILQLSLTNSNVRICGFGIKNPKDYKKTFQINLSEKSMIRIALGVIAGFFAWVIAWVGSEKIFWPFGRTVSALINARSKRLLSMVVSSRGHDASSHSYCPRCNSFGDLRIPGRANRSGKQTRAARSRLSAGGLWSTEGGSVLAECSHLVSRSLYVASTSNGDGGR